MGKYTTGYSRTQLTRIKGWDKMIDKAFEIAFFAILIGATWLGWLLNKLGLIDD
jgi:hypothetical protein